ncbi:MAG TPA: MBL fold metallo-hydrolase, partial [Acidobacteriota bacterium]|nr:MBL fold metallo-hydrolase [Acidobacteriota bacterium]
MPEKSLSPEQSLSEFAIRNPQSAILLTLLILLGRGTLLSQTAPFPSAQEGDLTKLAEGVYAQIVSPDGNAVGNSGVIVLEHSVLVFDTHFTPEGAQVLLSKIRAITPKAIRYVVNSHFHPDHTHGNQVFTGPL